MIITITLRDHTNEGKESTLTLNRDWTIEGDIKLTQRMIWLMNSIQSAAKEFKKREDESLQTKK